MEKMEKKGNYAFIDGQNLHLAIRELGWKLDYKKFRIYLKEKYAVEKAYYFIGYIEGNNALYNSLQSSGYILIFKPTLKNKFGFVKGNCDAKLVLQAMINFNHYEKALFVTGDGDFYCLVNYLRDHDKLQMVLVPNRNRYSALLKKSAQTHLAFMNDLKRKLEYKKYP